MIRCPILDPGSFSGRVFSIRPVDRIRVFEPYSSDDMSVSVSSCADVPGRQPSESSHPIGWSFSPPSVLFFSVERRSPSAALLSECLREIFPFPLDTLSPFESDEVRERARRLAIQRTQASNKSGYALVFRDCVFVGTSKQIDPAVLSWLSLGLSSDLLPNPVLWKPGVVSTGLLSRSLDRMLREPSKAPASVALDSFSVRFGKSKISGPTPRVSASYLAVPLKELSDSFFVEKLCFSASMPNGRASMDVDQYGVFSFHVPLIKGGLYDDRAIRIQRDFAALSSSVSSLLY